MTFDHTLTLEIICIILELRSEPVHKFRSLVPMRILIMRLIIAPFFFAASKKCGLWSLTLWIISGPVPILRPNNADIIHIYLNL